MVAANRVGVIPIDVALKNHGLSNYGQYQKSQNCHVNVTILESMNILRDISVPKNYLTMILIYSVVSLPSLPCLI